MYGVDRGADGLLDEMEGADDVTVGELLVPDIG